MAGKTKKVTIESLARMVARGFDDSKKDIDGLRKDTDGIRKDTDGLRKDIGVLRVEMNERFDKIENLMLADYKRRIEHLEVEMKELKSLLAV